MMGHSKISRSRKLEPHPQIQFSVIHRTPLFEESYVVCRGYRQRIVSLSREQTYVYKTACKEKKAMNLKEFIFDVGKAVKF